ncbi:unnamed protein product [Closterium sp. NIES-53]
MAPLRVLAFDHERRPLQFDTWLDDLQLYLLSDSRDSVSLFDHTSGAAPAPPATADTQALYNAVVARYSSPATTALGHLLLPYLFLELSAFATVEDLVSHLRTSDARYRAAAPAEFLDRNQPPMFITLYFIVTRLPDSLHSVRDHFLSLDTTILTIDLQEQHLLAAETSVVAVGVARGTLRMPFFEGCSPSPLAPSYTSAAAADVPSAEDVGAASASTKRRSSKGKGGRGGGGGSGSGGGATSGGGGGSGRGGSSGSGGGSGGYGGGGGGSGPGGGQRQRQQRRSETLSPQQLREWLFQCGASGGSVSCLYVIRTGDRAGQTCGKPHTQHHYFSLLDDAWSAEFGDEVERPHWAELLRSGVAIFDLDYDAILSLYAFMYAFSASAEGDYYRCVPPDSGIEATALGASESSLPGTAPVEALHTFTLDSGASRCFFRDSITLTPLPAPVPVRLADPSGGPVVTRSSTVLPCLAVPSGSLSGLHLPLFSTNLVSTVALHDSMVTTTTPGGVSIRSGSTPLLVSPPVTPDSPLAPPPWSPLPTTPSWHALLPPCLWSSWVFASPPALASPALPSLRREAAARRSSLLLVSPDDCSPADSPHGRDHPVLCLHSERGGEFSSNLLRDFRRGEGILQSFTLPDSPQQNGIGERHIGLVMEAPRPMGLSVLAATTAATATAATAAATAIATPTAATTAATAATASIASTAAPVCCDAMASLRVLAFDHEGRPVQFDTWIDDLQLYLLSDSKDSVSLFDLASGAAPAPPATADSATRSQWLTRDAAAPLAICNHLPLAECAHFGQHRTPQALYDAVIARYSSPATAALGRLLLPYLFPELSAFTTVEDLVSHLRTSDARYRATVPGEFLDRNQPPMFITLYFILTRLRDSLRSVRDHFLSLDPTSLTVDLLEHHLLAVETSAVAIGAARGTPRPPFLEGCSPSPLAPSYASAAAVDVPGAKDVGAASASAKRHSGKGKGSKGGGGGSGSGGGGTSGGGGGSGGGGSSGSGGGGGGVGGGGGGSSGSGGSGGGGTGGGGTGARRGGFGGGQRQQQQRRSETQSPQQLCEWFLKRGASGGSGCCPHVIRMGDRAGQTCRKLHIQHRCFSRLDDAWRAEFGDDVELPRWADLLRSKIAIFDLEFDAIISAMYALSVSAEGDCHRIEFPLENVALKANSNTGKCKSHLLMSTLHAARKSCSTNWFKHSVCPSVWG